jgi:hypothetical protein
MTAARRLAARMSSATHGSWARTKTRRFGRCGSITRQHGLYIVDAALANGSYPPIRDVRGNRRRAISDRRESTHCGRSTDGLGSPSVRLAEQGSSGTFFVSS